jgi:hypothetical protein
MPGLENWMKKRKESELNRNKASESGPPADDVLLGESPKVDAAPHESMEPDILLDEPLLVKNVVLESIESNPLWKVLIDTVEAEILFPNRLAYVRQNIIPTHQNITPEELTERTGFPLGVSMVILFRLREK